MGGSSPRLVLCPAWWGGTCEVGWGGSFCAASALPRLVGRACGRGGSSGAASALPRLVGRGKCGPWGWGGRPVRLVLCLVWWGGHVVGVGGRPVRLVLCPVWWGGASRSGRVGGSSGAAGALPRLVGRGQSAREGGSPARLVLCPAWGGRARMAGAAGAAGGLPRRAGQSTSRWGRVYPEPAEGRRPENGRAVATASGAGCHQGHRCRRRRRAHRGWRGDWSHEAAAADWRRGDRGHRGDRGDRGGPRRPGRPGRPGGCGGRVGRVWIRWGRCSGSGCTARPCRRPAPWPG